jgi:hypothetical protein
VKFALFLMREVFPQHDALCREEGDLMLSHLRGDAGAADKLGAMSGRTRVGTDALWGPGKVSTSRR